MKRERYLGEGYVKRIHVDQKVIRANTKNGTSEPAITIQTSGGPLKAMHAHIEGPSTVIYAPHKPLSCGARLWIETESEVRIA